MSGSAIASLLRRPVGDLATAALSWWWGELAATLRAVGSRTRAPLLTVTVDAEGRIDRAAAPLRNREVRLRVPAAWLLLHELRLPAVVRENLTAAVSAEIDRLTPFSVDTSLTVLGPPRIIGDEMTADLAVLPRRLVSPALAQLEDSGARVVRLVADTAPPWLAERDFLPGAARSPGNGPSRPMLAVLAVALSFPMTLDEGLALYQNARFDTAKAEASQTMQLAQELARRQSGASELDSMRTGHPPVSRVLADLSKALPDSAFLDGLTLEGETVSLSGYAVSAAALIPALESSGHFANVQFAGAVTRQADTGLERFQITAGVAETGVRP